ncbi:MAG: hypothetical protein FWE28_01420 [Oscillospiraceae bacterium]|nr:hypothetical protein [Oscillospiraceae bacterium]
MQKLIYISNNRDYAEQGNINENQYFKEVNKLLEQGWAVSSVKLPNLYEIQQTQEPTKERFHLETLAGVIVLEKPDEAK